MAARLRPHHQDEVRNKIQTSQLINRLTSYALGCTIEEDGEKKAIELSTGQLKAIEILLKKSLPDLSAIDWSASDGSVAEAIKGALAWKPQQ
jgi:hypothetical protein